MNVIQIFHNKFHISYIKFDVSIYPNFSQVMFNVEGSWGRAHFTGEERSIGVDEGACYTSPERN